MRQLKKTMPGGDYTPGIAEYCNGLTE